MRRGGGVVMLMVLAVAAGAGPAADPGVILEQRAAGVLAGEIPLTDVSIEVIWSKVDRSRLRIWGNGVGIWNGDCQLRLSNEELRGILSLFGKHGFFTMPERPAPRKQAGAEANPPALMRSVQLTIGDVSKLVVQNNRVNTLPALEELTRSIFEACEPAARKGRSAASLAEGLDLLADGTLAPEALLVVLNVPPEAKPAERTRGLIVSVEGGAVRIVRQTHGQPPTDPEVRRITADEVKLLMGVLKEASWASMPLNIFADRYTDITVSVLQHRHMIQGRRFAGKDPTAQSAERARLEKVTAAIRALAEPRAEETAPR